MFEKGVRAPIAALFLISLGGLLLHLRIHPPAEEAEYWLPAIVGVITTFALPFLFAHRKTVAWAYLVTWLAVIIGTVTMLHHSAEHWMGDVTLKRLLLETTFPDVLILAAKLPLAHIILRHFRPKALPQG